MPDGPVLVDPETCSIVRLETGFHVGGERTASTLLEWTSDARFVRFDVRSPTVMRFPDLLTARKALEVRADELLGSVYVLRDAPFRELLGKHEPWLSWNRAAASSTPLVELWKGLASAEDLEKAGRGMRVIAVRDDEIRLANESLLTCALPLSPDELAEAPWFLMPLLTRHVAIGRGSVGFSWDPAEPDSLMSLPNGDVVRWIDDQLLRDSVWNDEVVLPATTESIMNTLLQALSGS